MSLIVDGVRSIRRKWFADKKLAHIKAIGVQSKTLIWDGFVFRVSWQDDTVSLRHITAPMGVVVVSSGASGMTLYSAEYWLGPFTTKKVLHQSYSFPAEGLGGVAVEYEYMFSQVANTNPAPITPYYGGLQNNASRSRCSPLLCPMALSESILVASSAWLTDGPTMTEAMVCLFEQNGTQSYKNGLRNTQSLSGYLTPSTLFTVPSDLSMLAIRTHWSHFSGTGTPSGAQFAAVWSVRGKGDVRSSMISSSNVALLAPPETSFILSFGATGLGGYAFSPDQSTGVRYINANRPYQDYSIFFDELEEEHLMNRKWKLYLFTITYPSIPVDMTLQDERILVERGGEVTVFNAGQFLPLLDLRSGFKVLSDGSGALCEYEVDGVVYNEGGVPYDIESSTVEVDWEAAAGMLRNFFGWPNFNDSNTPHDNVLFHSPDAVFSWTRRYGSIEIRPNGLFSADITVPSVAQLNDGVRPVITHAGGGLYCCICDKVGDRVLGVYRGTPFDVGEASAEWEEIILVEGGWTDVDGGRILHVRPVLVTDERVVLLAITRDMLGADPETGDPAPRYCIAVSDGEPGAVSTGGRPATLLRMLSVIPVDDEDFLRFDITTYGVGEYTKLLREYPSPPPAVPQHSLATSYSDYPVIGE